MKSIKTIFIALLGVLAATSCSEDVTEVVRPRAIEVSTRSILLSTEQLTASFTVTTPEDVAWTISYCEEWLTVVPAEAEAGTTTEVTVTAESYGEDAVREGRIVLSGGEGVSNVTIRVLQQGDIPPVEEPALIWERSALARLNLKGRVKSCSLLCDIRSSMTSQEYTMENVQFDKRGRITAFQSEETSYSEPQFYEVIYEGETNRIKSFIQRFEGGESKADFIYGSHGVYLPTSMLLYDLSWSCFTYYQVGWIPTFIRDLEQIKVTRTGEDETGLLYTIDRAAGTGTCRGIHDAEQTIEGDYATYEVGHYPPYNDNFLLYEVNPANGRLISSSEGIPVDGGPSDESSYRYYYNDNELNTVKECKSPYPYATYTCTYNEQNDLVALTAEDSSASFTVEYEYDGMGNWVKATVSKSDQQYVYERTVEYW